MAYDAKAIADKVPPPDKLGLGGPVETDPIEPDADDAEADKALKVSQAEDIAAALGVKGADASALCEALDAYFGK